LQADVKVVLNMEQKEKKNNLINKIRRLS